MFGGKFSSNKYFMIKKQCAFSVHVKLYTKFTENAHRIILKNVIIRTLSI